MDELERAFLDALQKDEDDLLSRCAYADWLDEQDRPEDAQRQRDWPASKKWLVALAARAGGTCDNYGAEGDEDDWREITWEDLVMGGKGYADSNSSYWGGFTQMGDETLRDLFYDEKDLARQFWEHWCVVTGLPMPPQKGGYDKDRLPVPFSCSC